MSARRVHAVLAAGVQNPNLIGRWREDAEFLLRQGIEPDSLDLAALWKFAGLTVKVRHNGIRRDLPATFRFMSLAGIEIDVFASYATSCASQGRRYAATSAERTADLIRFLESWVNLNEANHSVLWDMIRHEQALALLSARDSALPVSPKKAALGRAPSPIRRSRSAVPVIAGHIILHEMRCNPRAVEAILFNRPRELDQISLETHYYCYWRSKTAASIQILDLDEFGYFLLSLIDGNRSTPDLSEQLGGGRRPNRRFLQAIDQLAALGIVDFNGRALTL